MEKQYKRAIDRTSSARFISALLFSYEYLRQRKLRSRAVMPCDAHMAAPVRTLIPGMQSAKEQGKKRKKAERTFVDQGNFTLRIKTELFDQIIARRHEHRSIGLAAKMLFLKGAGCENLARKRRPGRGGQLWCQSVYHLRIFTKCPPPIAMQQCNIHQPNN